MKIFGRGNNNAPQPGDDDLDIISDDDATFDDGEGARLTAPQRGMGGARGGGNRKFVLLLVLVGLLGGGYAALALLTPDDTPAIAALPPAEPLNPAAPAVDPNAPAPADALASPNGLQPPVDPNAPVLAVDGSMPPMPEMPPMPATVVTDEITGAAAPGPAPGPAFDPVIGAPVPSVADGSAPAMPQDPALPAAPVADAPVTDVIDAEAADAATAPAANAPVDPALAAAPMGGAPAAAVVQPVASLEQAPAAPADAAPGAPLAPAVPVADATAPVMPADAAIPPAALPAPAVAAPAVPASAALDATALAASEAEQALVNNADLVPPAEMMPVPRTPEDIANLWSRLPVEPAMVRPMPNNYLTVKKERAADSLDSRLASARRALNEGRSAAALQFFNDLRLDYPSDTRVLMGRAVALQRMGQNADALVAYEEVLTADPKHLDALTNMLGLLKAQNPNLAIEKLLELRTVYPYSGDITTQLAIAYGAAGNLPEALRYITLADALKPDNGYVLYNKAVIYDRMGRATEAAVMYRQLVRMSADGLLDSSLPIEQIKRRLAVMR
jgi:Flp pilus assembly protein TadD